ncbi:hypothetical protein EDC18_101120 [Natranaerovirga pectinivora]|uniref:Uncharacterized protein n=1 Tax=Natranaerovirga pectinivora TaxID=682400 RepID=A0A4R3MPW3_9FIRM|nr:hypothetical protein [Natranaerovirga pectinivora]TCT16824.1 hypothetical protein EDC18_101120 [Natranaerovirga pectinivora]
MVCKGCNEDISNEVSYCPKCGEEVSKTIEENIAMSSIFDNSQEIVEGDHALGTDNAQENNKKFKKSITSIVFACLFIVAITIVGVFGRDLLIRKDPIDILMASNLKVANADQIEVTNIVQINDFELGNLMYDYSQMELLVMNMLKDIQIRSHQKIDYSGNKMEVDLIVALRNNDLLSVNLYLDNTGVAFQVPTLYEKQFYITWDTLSYMIKDETGMQLTLDQYISTVFDIKNTKSIKNFKGDTYSNVIKDVLENLLIVTKGESIEINNKTIKGDKYTLDLDYNQIMALSISLLEIAIEDEQIIVIIEDIMNRFIDVLEDTGDINYLPIDRDSLNNIREIGNELKIIQEMYSPDLLNLYFDSQLVDDLPGINYLYDFYIKGNDLKAISLLSTISVENPYDGSYIFLEIESLTNIESINKNINFSGIDKVNGHNISELTDEDMENIMFEVQMKLFSLLLINPSLQEIMGELIF